MFKNTKLLPTKTIYRVTLGASLAVAFAAVAMVAVFSVLPGGFAPFAGKDSVRTVDLKQLEADYATNYTAIIGGYLAAASVDKSYGGDFAKATIAARDRLLALSVPARYKDIHLSSVIILSGIMENLSSRKTNLVGGELEKIRTLLANF